MLTPALLLRRLVAASATFQEVVGAQSASQARRFVFLGEASDINELGSRAIVNWVGYSRRKIGTGTWETNGGELYLSFEFDDAAIVPYLGSEDLDGIHDEITAFTAVVSQIISEMEAVASLDQGDGSATTHLNMIGLTTELEPQKLDATQENGKQIYAVAFRVQFE